MKKADIGLLILRLGVGGLMLPHGIYKLFNGTDYIQGLFTEVGLPAFFAYAVFLGEVVAPIGILLGYKVRVSSILLVLTCLVAILLGHPREIFEATKSGGWSLELLGLFLAGSITLYFTGPGKLSIFTPKEAEEEVRH